jgi:hypothetical protein
MLLEVIKAGIPSGVSLGLPEPLSGDIVRLCDFPRLLGDIDLADLTAVKGILPNHRLSFPPILAVTCYEAIHALYAQGTLIATIARRLGISRPTVYAYLRRAIPPAPRSPQRSGQVLRPYLPYLIRRWREGITDSRQLWREIEAQG